MHIEPLTKSLILPTWHCTWMNLGPWLSMLRHSQKALLHIPLRSESRSSWGAHTLGETLWGGWSLGHHGRGPGGTLLERRRGGTGGLGSKVTLLSRSWRERRRGPRGSYYTPRACRRAFRLRGCKLSHATLLLLQLTLSHSIKDLSSLLAAIWVGRWRVVWGLNGS